MYYDQGKDSLEMATKRVEYHPHDFMEE